MFKLQITDRRRVSYTQPSTRRELVRHVDPDNVLSWDTEPDGSLYARKSKTLSYRLIPVAS